MLSEEHRAPLVTIGQLFPGLDNTKWSSSKLLHPAAGELRARLGTLSLESVSELGAELRCLESPPLDPPSSSFPGP